MTLRINDVYVLSVASGRRLLRVGAAGWNEIEFVFERLPGERAELLVTLPLEGEPMIGEIDLPVIEQNFGRPYGLDRPVRRDEIEGVSA